MQCPSLDGSKFGKVSVRVVVVGLFQMTNLTCFHLSQVHVDCGRPKVAIAAMGNLPLGDERAWCSKFRR